MHLRFRVPLPCPVRHRRSGYLPYRLVYGAVALQATVQRSLCAGRSGGEGGPCPPSARSWGVDQCSVLRSSREESEPESRVSEKKGGRKGVLGASPAVLGRPAPRDGRRVESHGTDVKGKCASRRRTLPSPPGARAAGHLSPGSTRSLKTSLTQSSYFFCCKCINYFSSFFFFSGPSCHIASVIQETTSLTTVLS